ncbi:hypothetical protein V8E36_001838 [Tilletia maclaganii]
MSAEQHGSTAEAATAAAAEKAARKAAKKEAKKRKREASQQTAEADPPSSTQQDDEQHTPKKKKQKKTAALEAQDADSSAVASNGDSKKCKKKNKNKDKVAADQVEGATSTPAAAATKPSAPIAPVDAAAAREYLKTNNITIEVPDDDDAPQSSTPLPMLSFAELKPHLQPALFSALESQGFKQPTPIQACCWPILLGGSDVVGIAETGSGKTFGFGLPALQLIAASKPSGAEGKKQKGKGKSRDAAAVSMLVVAPTRELAIQTHENLALLATPLGVGSICLFGGVSKHEQIASLRSSSPPIRIVVGTPGRVLDLARGSSHDGSDPALDLSEVQYLVLDEADRMLDKGFEPDIRAIIELTRSHTHPEGGRHTSMFSATWPPAVRGLAESFMRNPTRVTVGSDELSANRRVSQEVEVFDDGRAKERRLGEILRRIGAGGGHGKKGGGGNNDKILIFALYKKEAQRVEQNLRRNGYAVSGIHGDLSQHDRMASLEAFKTAKTPLLVATDVAARGLDIPNVEYVINYTFPLTIEDYVHRIGRTGRGGKTGKSITFFTDEDKAHAGELMRVLKDADQPVPEAMNRFPTTIKKKTHSAFGDHFRELVPGKAKKITFD